MAELNNLPRKGLLTFHAEGNNIPDTPGFSRRAHHPSTNSGVTIGRGYDMLHRKIQDIVQDLVAAGVPENEAKLLAEGAGLSGAKASEFVKSANIRAIIISEQAQAELFLAVYAAYENNARRICTKPDVEARYGTCNWDLMDVEIKELITDLLYRGDYTPRTRMTLQKSLVSGDYAGILKIIRSLNNVPSDRMLRREQHLQRAALKRMNSANR